MDLRPTNTIYINNLNDKVKKPELKKSLFELFSQFGNILDIVALKTMSMRGQAFIVFKDITSASMAIKALNFYRFYDKPMRIQYSRKESDLISKMKGTYTDKMAVKPTKKKIGAADKENSSKKKTLDESGDGEIKKKKKSTKNLHAAAPSIIETKLPEKAVETIAPPIVDQPPYHILFLTNLPDETSDMMLYMLFNQYPGFQEVRMVPGRNDIAFVEFDSERKATAAKNSLQGFRITPDKSMLITYAKK